MTRVEGLQHQHATAVPVNVGPPQCEELAEAQAAQQSGAEGQAKRWPSSAASSVWA